VISSNSTTPKPSDAEVEAFISSNPGASDDDVLAYMRGQMPKNPERFNPIDMLAAPFMGFSKGATYGLTGRINSDYQKQVQQNHPLLYNAGQLGGMVVGGGAEVKALQALGRGAANVLPKVLGNAGTKAVEVAQGTDALGKATRTAGRTTHAAASGAAQAAGEGGMDDAAAGATVGGAFSLGLEGLITGGGFMGRLAGRKDYLDMVGTILNGKHEDAQELLGTLNGVRKAHAAQAYEKALENRFTSDPEILKIFQDPDIRSAYQAFADLQRERAALGQKFVPVPDPAVIDLYLQAGGNAKAARVLGEGVPLRVIHELSEELRAGNIKNVAELSDSPLKKGISTKILTALEDAEKKIGEAVPEYAAADKMYAKDSRSIHALKAGQGRLSPDDVGALKLAKKYAGDIPIFPTATATEIAKFASSTRAKALAGGPDAIDAANDLDHYAVGVYAWAKQQVEDHGNKFLTRPEVRNKIAALSGGSPDAAIKFYRAVTSGKERAAELATAAMWGATGHPFLGVHQAHRALTGSLRTPDAPDVFMTYLQKGSANPQDISDRIDLLRRTELYRPKRRTATTTAAKSGGAMMGEDQ
jgi:hypothetical protein